MNIKVEKKDLLRSLSQVQGILEKRIFVPILANILLEAKEDKLNMYASDTELNFLGTIPVKIKEEGKVVLDGKKLFDIIRELSSEEISFIKKENQKIQIKQGRSVFQIYSLKPSDFPTFPKIEGKKFQKIKTKEILNIIDKITYSASLDRSRYHLTGIYLERIKKDMYRFVATDGHRMSYIDISMEKSDDLIDLKEGIIIPRKAFSEIKKILSSLDEDIENIELSLEKPLLIIKFKNQILTVRLIEGKYPDYKQLIPKDSKIEAELKLEELISAIKRVSVLTSARFKGINFLFKEKELCIKILHPESGEASETIPCILKGESELEVKMNSGYILESLNSFEEKKIKMEFNGQNFPVVLKEKENNKRSSIIMPMKL